MSALFKITWASLKGDLLIPAILILVYTVFALIVKGTLPSFDALVNSFALLYQRFGYEIIFIAAAMEALVLVNFFVPGIATVALGAVFARTGHIDLTLVVLSASAGSLFGYTLDYLLGYFGLSDLLKKFGFSKFLNKAQKELKRFGSRGLVIGFIHPNIGSFLSFAAGASEVSFLEFFPVAALSTLVWMTVWGVAIYAVGGVFLELIARYSFLVVLVVICSLVLLNMWRRRADVRS